MKTTLTKTTAAVMIFALAFLGFGFVLTTDAQTRRNARRTTRVSDRQVEQIIRRIERRSDAFRRSFDAALDRSRFDGSYTEDSVNELVKAFETATNDLRSRFNGRTAVASDVDTVLNRAAQIDQFMRTNLRQARVQGDWTLLKGDLQTLANAYSVAFNLNGRILPPSVVAGQVPYRVSDSQVETVLRRIETKSDTFRRSLDRALDHSRFNNTNGEDNINEFVKDFENETDMLRRKFDGRSSVDADASNLLIRAASIDDFMRRNLRRETVAQRDWRSLRTDLNLLSAYYSLGFNLDNRRSMPTYTARDGSTLPTDDTRFTGTYRLNLNQSDNARTVADNATRYVNRNNRDRINDNLVRRLTAPEMLAVDRQGMRVMFASTVAPQVTLEVDNMEHIESYPNGRQSRVRASFTGDTLNIVSNGDRENDFTITLTSLDGGRRMLVTRSLYAEGLNQTVQVKSYYDRTDDQARFNIYNNAPVYTGTNTNVNNNFYLPDNTIVTAVLNNDLSTATAKDGDRFTMTVRSPNQYVGAIIEGYVSNANRSGRISGRSEINLNYETIRLSNNQAYRFAGITDSVRTTSGEIVRVDNEGTVKDSNQTNQTIGRTAIGTGIGAILGAIIGGGRGAAIGAVVGAGAGAGSVYIQGRDDLELRNGAEFTIRAGAPRSH
ncbi:MAG: YMGG-like glycine zipper-containing protein [Acidobacteriota bacterium]